MSCCYTLRKWLSSITVEPVLFLYMMIIFIETTVLQDLIYSKVYWNLIVANSSNSNVTDVSDMRCRNLTHNVTSQVEDKSSELFRYYNAVLFFFTFATTLYIGSWTDHFGRKKIMLIPPVGSALACVNNILQSHFINLSFWYLLISAFISGVTAGTVAIIATTFGYIADITDERSRTRRIVILEAMIFIGGTVGSYVSGGILHSRSCNKNFSNREVAFQLEMILCFVIIFYIIFHLPYNMPEKRAVERSMCWRLFNLSHISDIVSTIFQSREGKNRRYIILLLLVLTLTYYGQAVQFLVLYLFVRDEPLNWDSTDYSYFNGLCFAVEGAALLIGLPIAYYFCHFRDTTVGILGLASRMSGLILLGISSTNFMMFLCPVMFIFSEFSVPAIRSMLSKLVGETEKGKIFACTSAVQNICFLTGALIFNSLYPVTHNFFKGFCFEITAFLQFLALIILSFIHFGSRDIVQYGTLVTEGSLNSDDIQPGSLNADTVNSDTVDFTSNVKDAE